MNLFPLMKYMDSINQNALVITFFLKKVTMKLKGERDGGLPGRS